MLVTSSCNKRRSNNVSDVRPSSRRLRENTTYHVSCRSSLYLLELPVPEPIALSVHPQWSPGVPRHVEQVQSDQRLLRYRGAWHEFGHSFLHFGAPIGTRGYDDGARVEPQWRKVVPRFGPFENRQPVTLGCHQATLCADTGTTSAVALMPARA
ncbi:hypothetical protein MRX96_009765 [Rhipicephalus microplus]